MITSALPPHDLSTNPVDKMLSNPIIFHDLTSQKWPFSWSPFTLRTTLSLRHLNHPYHHRKTSYPDIAPTLSALNVTLEPETAQKTTKYTLPAITLTDETTIMGSRAIAEKLASSSAEYEGMLFPQGERGRTALGRLESKEVLGAVSARFSMGKHIIAFVPLFLDDRGAEYFNTTRREIYGDLEELRRVALEEEERKAGGLSRLVEEAVVPIYEFYQTLDGEGDGDGVFAFGGREPQYVDFCVVALLQWWVCARGEEEIMSALRKVGDGRLARIMDGCEGLLKPREL